ncbi:cilia- and flagella-associated protein 77 [Mugil cephalus]|uniref:cilia- and flagella-associated protein 77 n=1 Tax=Mugil cephalus TaxID=48193 RepID=UPI001FB6EE10|nr:cilia- and flagella-associated protein 77 [Mugil cephalus]
MSSPRLGVVRDTMLTNPLLIKDPLAQTRSRGLLVPGPDFTFGTSSSLTDGGVSEVLSGWRVQPRRQRSPRPLDFLSLNRDAVKSGLVTAKEVSQYRAHNQSPAPKWRGGGASQHPTPDPDVTFGVANRPSSPLSDLLSHQYARRWMEEQLSRNQTRNHKPKVKVGGAETRTSLLRRTRPLPVRQTPPQLPRFTQVAPALKTFRDPDSCGTRTLMRESSGTRRKVQDLD